MASGLVVAGGYSTRFGLAEKGLVEVGGESMIRRVVAAMAPVVDEVVIDCRAEQIAPFDRVLASASVPIRFVTDEDPDAGPVAGLATGLRTIDRERVVVGSCDRPGVGPALFRELLDECATHGAEGELPVLEGWPQPLCAAYEAAALERGVRRVLDNGNRRLCSVLEELSIRERSIAELRSVDDPRALRSVDTPLEASLWSCETAEQPRSFDEASTGRPALDRPTGTVIPATAPAGD